MKGSDVRHVKVDRCPNDLKPPYRVERGEWYVSRVVYVREWDEDGHEYLHADGNWRTSTFSGNTPSGYFASEEDAKAALAKARGETVK